VNCSNPSSPRPEQTDAAYANQRQHMVNRQIVGRGITDPLVLKAMTAVPRHRFVSPDLMHLAYQDGPLPTSHRQTISQPYIVAFMTAAARLNPYSRVLEVGTGSGYQTAILAELAQSVFSVEIVPDLARQAQAILTQLGYSNVYLKQGNGYQGWPDYAPYDAILVTAAPTRIPSALVDQLALGGRLVVPVGYSCQTLLVVTKQDTGLATEYTIPVRFVPMTGEGA
jgi:protein-L-isoaspartate(D-aspartate) O-methyltransferase